VILNLFQDLFFASFARNVLAILHQVALLVAIFNLARTFLAIACHVFRLLLASCFLFASSRTPPALSLSALGGQGRSDSGSFPYCRIGFRNKFGMTEGGA
ncbi:hypothetical protein BRC20_01045, partial [Candidatus Saccharibacteria bacterium QS_8_54_8]